MASIVPLTTAPPRGSTARYVNSSNESHRSVPTRPCAICSCARSQRARHRDALGVRAASRRARAKHVVEVAGSTRTGGTCCAMAPSSTSRRRSWSSRVHSDRRARLHRRVELRDLTLADQVRHGGGVDEHLGGDRRARCVCASGSSVWLMMPCRVSPSCVRIWCCWSAGKDVDDAVDALRRALRVKGRRGRGDRSPRPTAPRGSTRGHAARR